MYNEYNQLAMQAIRHIGVDGLFWRTFWPARNTGKTSL